MIYLLYFLVKFVIIFMNNNPVTGIIYSVDEELPIFSAEEMMEKLEDSLKNR